MQKKISLIIIIPENMRITLVVMVLKSFVSFQGKYLIFFQRVFLRNVCYLDFNGINIFFIKYLLIFRS